MSLKCLITVVLLNVSLFLNYSSGQVLFEDDFESHPVGSPPAGWILSGTTTPSVVDSVALSSNQSVHYLDPGSGTQANMTAIFAVANSNITVEYYMRTDDENAEGIFVTLRDSVGNYDYEVGFSNGTFGGSSGWIGGHSGASGWVNPQLLQYEVGKWYHVVRTLDFTTNQGSFYVAEVDQFGNDTANSAIWIVGAEPFWSISSANQILAWSSSSNAANAYIDSVRVYTVVDSDGDGIPDDEDAFPNDPNEWSDKDEDGTGDNADPDDDNDGLTDLEEADLGTDPCLADTDGDGVNDLDDFFPLDGSQSSLEEYVIFIRDVIVKSLPQDDWKNPNMCRPFANKLTVIVELIRDAETEPEPDVQAAIYFEAHVKVEDDLKAKTDGFHGGHDKNDWIVTEAGQDAVYPELDFLSGILFDLAFGS